MALQNKPEMVDKSDEALINLTDKELIDAHNASILTHQVEMLSEGNPSTKEQLSNLMNSIANNVEDNLGGLFGLDSDEIAGLHKMDDLSISGGFTNV